MSDLHRESMNKAIDAIDSLWPDARQGLPEPLFLLVSRMTPLVNVDLLIVNESGEKLLTWRHDQFYGPGWHIPGGIVRFKETMAERLAKVARREIGCGVEVVGECLRVSEIQCVGRDVRGHFVSHLFKCRLIGQANPALEAGDVNPRHGQWAWFKEAPPELIPQHKRFADLLDSVAG